MNDKSNIPAWVQEMSKKTIPLQIQLKSKAIIMTISMKMPTCDPLSHISNIFYLINCLINQHFNYCWDLAQAMASYNCQILANLILFIQTVYNGWIIPL